MAASLQQQTDAPWVVVGGGPVGALLALALAQRGIRVEVYERRLDLRKHAISAGRSINLAVSVRGLSALGEVGLADAVLSQTVRMAGRMVRPQGGAKNLQPYGRGDDEAIHSMSRGGLNALLLGAAEATGLVDVYFQHRLLDWDPDQHEALFRDESTGLRKTAPAARIFGTDGSASALREVLVRHGQAQESLSPLDFGYKELTIPPLPLAERSRGFGPDGRFALEPEALHIWPRGRFMLIALANPDGSFTATLFLPYVSQGADPGFDRLASAPDVWALFATTFPDVLPLIPDLPGEFLAAPTGAMVTVRTSRWDLPTAKGGALLLGDAAHAIVPFFGQGMNCGFEDVSELCRDLDAGPADFASWIGHFAARRKPDADAIADLALENFVEMRDKVADPQFLLQRAVEAQMVARLGRRYWTRYQLVSFSRVPYRAAKAIGALQASVLQDVTAGCSKLSEVDLDRAEALVRAEVLPAFAEAGVPEHTLVH